MVFLQNSPDKVVWANFFQQEFVVNSIYHFYFVCITCVKRQFETLLFISTSKSDRLIFVFKVSLLFLSIF